MQTNMCKPVITSYLVIVDQRQDLVLLQGFAADMPDTGDILRFAKCSRFNWLLTVQVRALARLQ